MITHLVLESELAELLIQLTSNLKHYVVIRYKKELYVYAAKVLNLVWVSNFLDLPIVELD
jgi:hypothetical protein